MSQLPERRFRQDRYVQAPLDFLQRLRHRCQRERKDSYPFNNGLFRPLIQKTRLNSIFGSTLLPMREVIEDERRFYDYYHDTARRGVQATKWEKVIERVFDSLDKHGIDSERRVVKLLQGVRRVIGKYYLWRAPRNGGHVNRELIQKNVRQIFRFAKEQ